MRPMLRVLPVGVLILVFVLASPIQATMILQVPDTQQPVTGSIGNPINNACAPVSAVNVTEYWDVVRGHPNAFHVNATLIPNTAADYLYYFMDTSNWGSPVRLNGTTFPPSNGTYSADIQPGLFEFVRWDNVNLFTTPPPVLPAQKLGYNWTLATDYQAGFPLHVASIDSGLPDVLCFRYWNPIFSGFILNDPSGEIIEFYTWGPMVPTSTPPDPDEQWNLNYGEECIGHAVTGVGYYMQFDPDGTDGPLPFTDWFICHDNWPSTGVNVALPWNNWAASIFANPGTPEEPPEISYWKPDTTYALTGMPDFPSQLPCHSGPTAVTNCLWWYGAMDYYQFNGPRELRNELFSYFRSDTIFDPWGGTDVHQMEAGLFSFFNDVIPAWPFAETTYQRPDFHVMAESLMKCQDIILLIGNWWLGEDGAWWRDGGRYVTMVGVDTATLSIALSDPETDNAEAGGYGRVRPPHAIHSPTDVTHWLPMTAGDYDYPVSHDAYNVNLQSPSPGGSWWIPGFPRGFSPSYANCPEEFMNQTAPNPDPSMYPYHAEVEYAVMICPSRQEEPIDTCNFYKAPYPDYAQNGMPDFDQKQDNWWNPRTDNFSWCGPVALANCIWWFDSKFETSPVDPRPFYPSAASPPPNDHFRLLTSYGPWDDHDTNNVMPFISQLGPLCNVDVLPNRGTALPDLQSGFHAWLTAQDMVDQFASQIVMGPGYPEIRDSIVSSQDVILLLGFYEQLQTGGWQWLGGHYVTCAGACLQEPNICISDPFFDANEGEPPPGTAHGSWVHNDTWFVSGPHGTIHHDLYHMTPVSEPIPSPATWVLADYPNRWTQDGIFTFANENPLDPGMPTTVYQGGQILVAVDAALIICPAQQQRVPDIDVLPDSLFYQQNSNTTATYTDQITICNLGDVTLTVSSITSDLGWVSAEACPDLAPGGCATLDVTINTTGITPGTYTGRFHVSSNDPDEPVVDKPWYSVTVVEPDIRVDPDSIFHSQLANTLITYSSDFTVVNVGTADLTYATANTLAWVTLGGVSGLITPGGFDNIDVTVNTTGIPPGTYLDSVTISSNDPDTPVLNRPIIVIEVTQEPIEPCDFYKASYPDYAQNGMPDFDQKQDAWMNPQNHNWSWCGPVALANCIWWFDSKFETAPVDPRPFYPDPGSPPPNDHFPLLTSYEAWDDHDINNVMPFISQLGPLCNVDIGPTFGTALPDLETGFHIWLTMHDMIDQFTSMIVIGPNYPEIRDSIVSSQDVILLLGFYEELPTGGWHWLGSHYVTCAGVCLQEPSICISDPFLDTNEGEPPPGSAHGPDVHNDTWFVSGPHGTIDHDRYQMALDSIPGSPATWMLVNYPNNWFIDGLNNFAGQNPLTPGLEASPYQEGPIWVMVDAALIICPAQQGQVPDIDVVPDFIYHSQNVNVSITYPDEFGIYNNGTAVLNYTMSNTLSWIMLGAVSGSIPPTGSDLIDLTINTTGIATGTYVDSVTINSNDPDTPILYKPVIVIDVIRPQGCDYVVGDANGNGTFNGLDVTYSVSYFKGGPPPPYECDCPPHGTWYVAGDVNQSCSFNGLDVTYMVAYLKGGPPPHPCPDCPPISTILGKKPDKGEGSNR